MGLFSEFGTSTHVDLGYPHTYIRTYSRIHPERRRGNAASETSTMLTCKWKKNEKNWRKGQKFSHFKYFIQRQQQQLISAKATQRSPLMIFIRNIYIFPFFFSAFFILCHATLITFYVPPICSLTHTHKLNEVKTNIYASVVCVCVCVYLFEWASVWQVRVSRCVADGEEGYSGNRQQQATTLATFPFGWTRGLRLRLPLLLLLLSRDCGADE